jgi:hypothetical protein
VHGLGGLRENTNHEISLANVIVDLVHGNHLIATHQAVLLWGFLRLTLAANDAGSETLLGDASTGGPNIAEANNKHSFVRAKLDRLNRPTMVAFLLCKAFYLLGVV